jgi:hypothetical protein
MTALTLELIPTKTSADRRFDQFDQLDQSRITHVLLSTISPADMKESERKFSRAQPPVAIKNGAGGAARAGNSRG